MSISLKPQMQNSGPVNHGICFSPYQDGQSPNFQTIIPPEQITMLVNLAAPYFKWFLTYGSTDGLQYAAKAAKKADRMVAAGAYITQKYSGVSEKEVNNLIEIIEAGNCDMAIVGNEALSNGVEVSYLKKWLLHVKPIAKKANIPLTTALIASNWTREEVLKEILPIVDVCNIHIYPWWDHVRSDVGAAIENLKTVWKRTKASIQNNHPGKACFLGETGWPSHSNEVNDQQFATLANQIQYFNEVMAWAKAEDIEVFWFEMIDEKWKKEPGEVGPHWGIWESAFPGQPPALKWGQPPIPPVPVPST